LTTVGKVGTFHPSDVTLANPDVRWKHREHLAEICKLTEQTLNLGNNC
jgi:hypothetical protein